MSTPVLRFAPSPNGELHLGHALSALINGEIAKALGGRLLLRMENIDLARCTPAFEARILEDLAWLGLEWEVPVRRQCEHFALYRKALDRLIAEALVYPAFMSRGEIGAFIRESEASGQTWPRDPDGAPLYPGLDKSLSDRERRQRIGSGAPYAWRLDMASALSRAGAGLTWTAFSQKEPAARQSIAAAPERWGDIVIARRDIPTSYPLAVVVDDAWQGVSHVVRGADLLAATGAQRLLQHLFGLPPPIYCHHRLVLGPDGKKLSMSRKDTSLRALREAGTHPRDIRRLVGL